jgi:hypothetical protein
MSLALFNECVHCHQPSDGRVVALMSFPRFRDLFSRYPVEKSAGIIFCNGQMLLAKDEFVAVPICTACYMDPAKHLKAHYFGADQVRLALERAGSNNLGG